MRQSLATSDMIVLCCYADINANPTQSRLACIVQSCLHHLQSFSKTIIICGYDDTYCLYTTHDDTYC